MENKRYLELYDKHGMQILGSSGIYRFDNRLTNENAVHAYAKQVKNQYEAWKRTKSYIRPRAKYCKVIKGIRSPKVLTDTIMLHDLF